MGIRRTPVDKALAGYGVDAESLRAARSTADRQGMSLRQAARKSDKIDPVAVAKAISELSGLPVLYEVDHKRITPDLIRNLPLSLTRERGILPLYLSGEQLVVGLCDLNGLSVCDDIRVLLGRSIRPVIVPSDVLELAMNDAYERAMQDASAMIDGLEDEFGDEGGLDLEADLIESGDDEAPVIRFVNALLTQAIKERSSDIHIEPFEKDLIVRYRVDGVLHEAHRPPQAVKARLVARVKIMAGLNIAEKRLPQDGRIRRRMGGREIDLRVSTVPVRHGERVVMRILEKGKVISMGALGMPDHILEAFGHTIKLPHGILLVCGPTGSGKSTTLNAAITSINSPDKNILTIEDPIEYEVHGVGQVQVNHKINLTFASALRSFLRQDPDVILVGEIRDQETADNAVQASLTGHLVFSTIHTNDSAGAFARLTEMGVQPFLIASSLEGVLAQRLVRRLCTVCRAPYIPSDEELSDLEVSRSDIAGHTVYRAKGCNECNSLGYNGRIGIYEFLGMREELKPLIISNADSGAIKAKAIELGMKTLRDDGVAKVLEGVTTFDEILRVARDGS